METKPYETRDADVRWIAISGALVVFTTVVTMALLAVTYRYFANRGPQAAPAPERVEAFPAPRLETAPREDLAAFRAREDAELHSYGWIDRQAGVVRVPVERAMDLIVERGLPVREEERK